MLDAVIYWIRQYQIEFFWLLFFPVLTFLLGLVMMLVVIGRLPENYFLQSKIVNGSEPHNISFVSSVGGLISIPDQLGQQHMRSEAIASYRE